jgi:hypothetical protein
MNAESALRIVETSEVETKALSIVDQARSIVVKDCDTYTIAGNMWKTIRDMMKEVADTFDPIIKKQHEAHRLALEQKAKYYAPLEEAQKNIKRLMSDYDARQEQLRKEEEARLTEIARKEAEERALIDAIEAENNGDHDEAAAILDDPVYVPPTIIPKATPRLAGGPVYREVWSAQVTDIKALCRAVADGKVSPECVVGNMTVLNKMATALKKTMSIPGVMAVSKRV